MSTGSLFNLWNKVELTYLLFSGYLDCNPVDINVHPTGSIRLVALSAFP